MVRAFARGAMGCRIDPSWGALMKLFLVPRSEMYLRGKSVRSWCDGSLIDPSWGGPIELFKQLKV